MVARSALPSGNSAAASATPTGARGKAARPCQVSVAGLNAGAGRTCTVVVSWKPAPVITVSVPDAAESGTVVVMVRADHWESGSAALVSPPPPRVKRTVPDPRTAPKPNP